jgi:hypothetical protein
METHKNRFDDRGRTRSHPIELQEETDGETYHRGAGDENRGLNIKKFCIMKQQKTASRPGDEQEAIHDLKTRYQRCRIEDVLSEQKGEAEEHSPRRQVAIPRLNRLMQPF